MKRTTLLLTIMTSCWRSLCAVAYASDNDEVNRPSLLVVVGAAGSEEFGEQFRQWAGRWSDAAKRGQAKCQVFGLDEPGEKADRDQLREAILAHEPAAAPLWLVLIGHGTFDGKTARFNLRGPDFSSAEMKDWLGKVTSPIALVDCSASSGPFLAELSAAGRVVITATKSGSEYNFAHFGDFLSAAIADPAADLDKDEQTSLLEAFLAASARLREFYAADGRLATEHALLDDNGDRQGVPADWFQGVLAIKSAKNNASLDGQLANQFVLIKNPHEQAWPAELLKRRSELEGELAKLRQLKRELPEAEYLTRLEPILVELAQLARQAAGPASPLPKSDASSAAP